VYVNCNSQWLRRVYLYTHKPTHVAISTGPVPQENVIKSICVSGRLVDRNINALYLTITMCSI